MKRIFLGLGLVAILAGCAGAPQQSSSMASDWRTGTDYTPYRTIPVVLQCVDCRY